MPVINITVRRKKAISPLAHIVCGNADYQIAFHFDDEWSEYTTKTARFIWGGQYVDVVFQGDVVDVPVITNTSTCAVGVFAGDLRTTTPAFIGCDRSILCGTGSPAEPTPDVYAQIMELLNQGGGGGAGMTKAQVNALDGLFKIAAYKEDASAAYAAFRSAFGLDDDPVVPDEPDEPDEPVVTTYTVTNNLTNVTSDNDAASVSSGSYYSANLTAEDGYTIDTVVITMGGVEISAYGDGVVSIDTVTGDVVITATAIQADTGAAVYELAEAATFDGTSVIDTGHQLNLTDDAWTICVDFTGSAGQVFGTHGTVDAHELSINFNSGWFWQASLCGKAVNGYTKNDSVLRYVLVHNKGETQATAYYLKEGAVTSESGATHWGSANGNPTTLKLGGKRDGTPNFVGTINRFAIYDRVLTAEEISEFMGVE